jgi:hypothetical protein
VREITFPPHISDSKVKTAVDTYIGLIDEMKAADRVVVELEGRRDAVIEADRRQYAEAIRRGEEEPGPVELNRFEKQLADARRRAEGLAMAVSDAEGELLQVVEERRAAWGADIDRAVEKNRAAVGKAVAALETAVAELSASLTTRLWIDTFPNKIATLRPPAATSAVAGLISRSGEPYSWPEVAAALRSFGQPPVAAARPVLHTPQGQVVVSTRI